MNDILHMYAPISTTTVPPVPVAWYYVYKQWVKMVNLQQNTELQVEMFAYIARYVMNTDTETKYTQTHCERMYYRI